MCVAHEARSAGYPAAASAARGGSTPTQLGGLGLNPVPALRLSQQIENAGYTPSLVQHCSAALLATGICHVAPAGGRVGAPGVRSTLLRRIQSVHRCYGLSRAASVTCVDCCPASARPIVPPLVWLQPPCPPPPLLLCGCLSAF